MTLKDTEFIEQEEFDLLTIANWFGLTPDQLGYPKGSQSYSSLEIMTQRHLDNAINPWLTRIEQAYTQKLLSREEKQGGVFVEFDRAAAIRMDSETKSRSISLNVQAGVLSTNEGREQLGLPPRTDGLGDLYIMPLNMSFADQRKDLAAATGLSSEPPFCSACNCFSSVQLSCHGRSLFYNIKSRRNCPAYVTSKSLPKIRRFLVNHAFSVPATSATMGLISTLGNIRFLTLRVPAMP